MSTPSESTEWSGRFPANEIISLLSVDRHFNLAESTSQDLHVGDLIDLVGLDTVRGIKLGYGSAEGLPELRDQIARLSGLSADQVVTTNGAALAIHLTAIEVCRPGDRVVLFTPCFPPSRDALLGAGVDVVELPTRFDDGYRVDLEAFAAALSADTKLVSLASPQNPSGVTTSPDVLRSMLSILDERAPHARLFADETYRFASHGDEPMAPSAAALDSRVITVASISKAFGAPGLRVGWITTSDDDLRRRLITAKLNVVISGSPLDETLAAEVLTHRDAILEPRRRLLAAGRDEVERWQAGEANRIEWVRPDAGALCALRLRPTVFDADGVARFWAAHEALDLQLADGSWFGEEARTFRLGFGYLPLERLPAALDAISSAMDEAARR